MNQKLNDLRVGKVLELCWLTVEESLCHLRGIRVRYSGIAPQNGWPGAFAIVAILAPLS